MHRFQRESSGFGKMLGKTLRQSLAAVSALVCLIGCATDLITQPPKSVYIDPNIAGGETARLTGMTDVVEAQFGLVGAIVAADADFLIRCACRA
jgi:hypothetical protein